MQKTDRIDPELIAPRLDLGRAELRSILDRYAPRTALIVDRQASSAGLKDALMGEGWRTRRCEGPGRTRCPLLEGRPCYLRESADVAVVYIDGRATWPGSGLVPRLRCAVDPPSPAVIALEGRLDPPLLRKRHGRVGALRSPAILMKAVRAVAGPDSRVPREDEPR